MDFSGDQESGNYKYLGVVACTEEFLNRFVRGTNLVKMAGSTTDKKAVRRNILSKLDARSPECLVLCVKTDKNSVLSEMAGTLRRQKRTVETSSLEYAYNRAVVDSVRKDLARFLAGHGHSLAEIQVESDGDCRDLLKHSNIRRIKESHAHRMADAVAWANSRGLEPKGVKPQDVTAYLHQNLNKQLKKKLKKRKLKTRHKT